MAGEEAQKVFNDAQKMLERIQNEKLLRCCGTVGFWRANSVGDDIYLCDSDGQMVHVLYGLRQQVQNAQ